MKQERKGKKWWDGYFAGYRDGESDRQYRNTPYPYLRVTKTSDSWHKGYDTGYRESFYRDTAAVS